MEHFADATVGRSEKLMLSRSGIDRDVGMGIARIARMQQVAYNALAFAESHGLITYDISDAKGTPIILWSFSNGGVLARIVRLAMYGGLYVSPVGFRKLLGVKPSRYAHGSAMLASAYLELASSNRDPIWIDRAKMLLQWLTGNTAEAPVGKCWGASFPWFSYGGVIPTAVGNAHSTIWAANAFFSYYKITGEDWALDYAIQACDFLAHGLHATERPTGSVAMSYTVLDHSECINVNADASSILLRAGKIAGRRDHLDKAHKMALFVVETQMQDGSWYYDEPVPGLPRGAFIDGFHTGMVLSALIQIISELDAASSLREDCRFALNKGLHFYIQNLFTPDGKPMYAVRKLYPIDPYSCGQGINTLVDVLTCNLVDPELERRSAVLLHKLADRTLELMLDSDGSFLTARYRFRSFRLKSLRWAQAVLILAFLRYSALLSSRLRQRVNRVEPDCAGGR